MYDNLIMTGPAPRSPHRRWLTAPFSRRAWAEVRYTVVTLPLSVVSFVFALVSIANGPFWAVTAIPLRKLGGAARHLARDVITEDVPDPEPPRLMVITKVSTPEPARLAEAAKAAGAKVWVWRHAPAEVTVRQLPPEKITELAVAADIPLTGMRPENAKLVWYTSRLSDPVAWRVRGYFGLKLPLVLTGLAAIAAGWLGGLFYLTYPAWWALGFYGLFGGFGIRSLGLSFALVPLGVALLYAGSWLTHNVTEGDRWLMHGLLGPRTSPERVRALEETRARAVDDSAARLRTIERDLHDGTQAQLVALAMKLGLAMQKLEDASTVDSDPVDLPRVTQLVGDAHRGALEAIEDLRTLARGIHPPVLDKGLTEALTVLAERSTVPVELVTDIQERPTDAIETIAYFSAAELLTNVAKHSGARHATLEAVHVPGLLRIRVTDDGRGGARPVASGGLRGLAERIRTVDGRLEIDSPQGGPTTLTVELPSHA
jgi:signal transduction histidine kinase